MSAPSLLGSLSPLGPGEIDRVRPWRERAMLATTLAVFALLLLWLGPLAAGLPFLLAGVWLVAGPVLALVSGASRLRSGTYVTPDACPNWHASLEATLARLGWQADRRPWLIVVQDPRLNAWAQWWPGRPIVVLTHGLVEALARPTDEPLRRAILGHELAHARWHVLPLLWTRGPAAFPAPTGAVFARLLAPLQSLIGLGTLAWSRQAEQAADRVALVAAGSLGAVATVLTLVTSGVRPSGPLALRRQMAALHAPRTARIDRVGNLLGTHPLLAIRLRAVADFACSTTYGALVGPELREAARWDASELGFHTERRR